MIGDSTVDKKFILRTSFSYYIPTNLIDFNNDIFWKQYTRYRRSSRLNETHINNKNYPAMHVIITEPTNESFKMLLHHFKESIWWNHEALFLIINKHIYNNCTHARTILEIMWSFNILSAVYLCINQKNNVSLYTFNPYNNIAPKFWNVTLSNNLNSRWTLLEHQFEAMDKLLFTDRKYNINSIDTVPVFTKCPRPSPCNLEYLVK